MSLLKIQSDPLGNLREQSGDEMNAHFPQNVLAETELRHLAAIPYQIVSPANNSPIIGIYQDSLLGAYRFTRSKIDFTPRDAMNLLMMYPYVDTSKLIDKPTISNFEILSQIMPPITLMTKTKLFEDGEDYHSSNNVLEIINGEYKRGQIEKSVLGSSTKGIIHRAFNDFGNREAADFIDNIQNVVNEYMKTSSYSVGISDLIADKRTTTDIIKVIADKKLEVKQFIDNIHLGIFKNETANSNLTEFENRINNTMKQADNETGKIGRKSLNKNNRFLMIVNSGSKGTLINIAQMISCLGQQNVDGKRIPYGFDSRTLPHYSKFDDSPNARGYIENSYISGLTAPELFFHAMGGRIGLIDTAVKTSQTGYIQRRLIKGLEDLKVEYDMTVRNSKGKIIQFSYGDDNFDSTKVENQSIPLVGMSVEDIYMMYDIIGVNSNETNILDIYSKGAAERIRKQKADAMARCQGYINYFIDYRDDLVDAVFKNSDDNSISLPVSFMNTINNIQGSLGLGANSVVDITPLECFELVEEYYERIKNIHFAPPKQLFRLLYNYYLNPRDLLCKKRFHRKAIIMLLETIVLKYKQAIVHPGEMVGVIAGQSIGEPTTQLTLNSVTYETEIIVRNKMGQVSVVQIGDFVNEWIKKSAKMEYMKDKDTTYAELSDYYEVPSATENGETKWCRIEAVTKHPVINEDGSNTMLKIKTKGCRDVIITKAKSVLQLVDGKIQEIAGSELKTGQYLPVSKKQIEHTPNKYLELKTILPPTDYIYGSEMEKARSVCNEYHWWSKYSGSYFVIPYNRSDSAYAALIGTSDMQVIYKNGYVYSKTNSICHYEIPENIELDYNFGYLLGAYCAEGCMTKHQLSISNNDAKYFKPIEEWCQKHKITTKIYLHENKNQEGWTSQDIRMYSTILCNIIEHLCGKLSHNKFISNDIIFSNKNCQYGFIDAYFGGDGCIHSNSRKVGQSVAISACSVSHKLLQGVQLILKNNGILSKIYQTKKLEHNNRNSPDIKQPYLININNKQSQRLAKILNMKIEQKQSKLDYLINRNFKYEYCKADVNIPNMINGNIVYEQRNNRFPDIEFDEIVSIEEVKNTTPYAYDLTVEYTRNFDIANGLCLRDTFHLAGVASKSNVTRGVPRIEEILRLTKNPKRSSLTVFLKGVDEGDMEKASNYANMIEHTRLIDVVSSIQICFDPSDTKSNIEADALMMENFYEFEKIIEECNDNYGASIAAAARSKWIVRMEMDSEILLDKNITMDDIHFAIKNSAYGNDIMCVYSDYNADKLVFRVRLNGDVFNKNKKHKPETLDQSDEIYLLKNFQDNILNNIVLRGVSGIENVLPRKIQNTVSKQDGKYVRKDAWVLDTTGSNLLETLALDYIDSRRTVSNDIREVFDVLGIEAARQTIHDELVDVMAASDVTINYHHTSLLCDRMTCNKDMVSIFRTGILGDNIGPIAKSTFEVHTEVLLDAARHGEFDHMKGVSANVMCGQYGYYGTNAFQLVLDLKQMEKLDSELANISNREDEIDNMFGKMELESELCPRNNIEIKNNIENIKHNQVGICDDDYNMGF
jgi:DNA-directed RNA polymerase beta' subunit